MKISILEKSRAPSENVFRKGLEYEDRIGLDREQSGRPRWSENAVHVEESEDGNSSERQKRQETENELLGTALGDEVEIDATNGTSAIRDRLVCLVHTDLLKRLGSLPHYYRRDYRFFRIPITPSI